MIKIHIKEIKIESVKVDGDREAVVVNHKIVIEDNQYHHQHHQCHK